MTSFSVIAELGPDPAELAVYEHGWQSWSPAGLHAATATSARPRRPQWQDMAFRPGRPGPETGFQGEGLLAVVLPDGTAEGWMAKDPTGEVPSIRAEVDDGRLAVSADGAVDHRRGADLAGLITAWADELATRMGAGPVPAIPPGWCSWYGYFLGVSEDAVLENLATMERLNLPIATVQIDDGHQAGIGDWLERSPAFGPARELTARIRDTGRRAGLWTAPFCVGARSRVAREHPEWLVRGAGFRHWDQQIHVLDVTHPGAAEHLRAVYAALAQEGFAYHKIDFVFCGAMDGGRHGDASGIDAYREGLRLIREGIGADAVLLGCGAPLLPSVGLVDAMRVSPDIDPRWEPLDDDISQPSGRGARAAGQARGWMHGRWWANDPDCLIARPEMEHRDDWAAHVAASGGLVVSGDPLGALDGQGLALTRELLRPSSPDPVDWQPAR